METIPQRPIAQGIREHSAPPEDEDSFQKVFPISKDFKFFDWTLVSKGTHALIYRAKGVPDPPITNPPPYFCLKLFRKDWNTPANLELNAYELILQHRDAHRYVPKFYGYSVRNLSDWGVPGTYDSDEANQLFTGIVIEWIENAEQLSTENVTARLASRLVAGLSRIHDAGVLHYDAYRRNQLVVPSTGRAVWIDFSCAHFNDEDIMYKEFERISGVIIERVLPPNLRL
jgi:hypothetical protein